MFFLLRLSPAVDVLDGTPGKDKDGGQVGVGDEAFQDVPGGVEMKYEAVRSGIFVS